MFWILMGELVVVCLGMLGMGRAGFPRVSADKAYHTYKRARIKAPVRFVALKLPYCFSRTNQFRPK